MGCGACSNFQVADSNRSLHRRLRLKLANLRDTKINNDLESFVSMQEIKGIQNAIQPLRETIHFQQLHKLQAGQPFLLSKQRRAAWKVAIYEPLQMSQIPPFSEHPTAKHEKTKSRFHQISLDINRTFPGVTQLNRSHLTTVLQNLSLCFQAIGYTQGMNFLVGFLLLCGFSPKEAFQMFVRLSHHKQFLLIRNFNQNFQNVNCCALIMQQVMKQSQNDALKAIIAKIESLGVNLFLFVFSWFLSYFLYNFNLKTSLLIWDYLILFPTPQTAFFNGNGVVPKERLFGGGLVNSINFALKIMQSLSEKILACSQLSDIMGILRHDVIEQHINEVKGEELLASCRSAPLLDWPSFKLKCQKVDQQLYKIISDIQDVQTNKANKGHFASFMNQCRYVKRSQQQNVNFQ